MNFKFPRSSCGSQPREAAYKTRYAICSTYFHSSTAPQLPFPSSLTSKLNTSKERGFPDNLRTDHLNFTGFFGKKVAPGPKKTATVAAENTGSKAGEQQSTPQSGKKLALPKRKDASSTSTLETSPSTKKIKGAVNVEVIQVSDQEALVLNDNPSVSNSIGVGNGHSSAGVLPGIDLHDPFDVPMHMDEEYVCDPQRTGSAKPSPESSSAEVEGKVNELPCQLNVKGMTAGGSSLDGRLKLSCSQPHVTLSSSSGKVPMQGVGELWTSKYRPRCAADLVGNHQLIARLREWLLKWGINNPTLATGGGSSRGRGKQMEEPKKAVLMSGPPGIGKTSSATILCQELGYEIVEVNASDSRGKADGEIKQGVAGRTCNKIKELITNHCMAFDRGASMSSKKMVLIMDEVDGMSGGDRGGIQDLIKSIKVTRIPIICICNDRYNRKLQSLGNHCLDLNFQKPTRQQVSRRLIGVAQKEHLQVDERTLETLLDSVQCDIRLALNHMQFIQNGSAVISYDDTVKRAQERAKDVALSPFNAAERLLSAASKDISLENRINLVFQDADLVPLLIQENYINYCPFGEKREDVRMDLISKAADSLCVGDMVTRIVRQQQRWDLMPLACVESAVTCSAIVRGSKEFFFPGERSTLRFSGWLGKRSSTGKNSRLLSETQMHLLVSGNCLSTRNSLRLDYMSHLCRQLVAPLREQEKEGVVQVIEIMEEYCLSREDRDTLLEMSQMKGQKDLLEGVSAQVKSTFTRVLNQRIGERSVKSSVLLADVKVWRGTVATTPASENAVDNDVVAVDNEGDTMEDDSPEDSQEDISAIPGVRLKPLNKSGATASNSQVQKGHGHGGRGAGGGRGKNQTRKPAKNL